MLELSHSEVARINSSQALFPKETDSNVSCLDHRAVIRTITDSESDICLIDIFNGFYNLSFLKRAQSTADDCPHRSADFQELTFRFHVFVYYFESLCLDQDGLVQKFSIFVGDIHDIQSLGAAVDFHSWIEQTTRKAYTLRSFELVSCQNPQLDVCIMQGLDCLRDIILKPIFNDGRTQQEQVTLQLVIDISHPLSPGR